MIGIALLIIIISGAPKYDCDLELSGHINRIEERK